MVIFFVKKHTSNDIFNLRKYLLLREDQSNFGGRYSAGDFFLNVKKVVLGCFTMLYILCGKANPVIKWIGDRQDQFAERAACYS